MAGTLCVSLFIQCCLFISLSKHHKGSEKMGEINLRGRGWRRDHAQLQDYMLQPQIFFLYIYTDSSVILYGLNSLEYQIITLTHAISFRFQNLNEKFSMKIYICAFSYGQTSQIKITFCTLSTSFMMASNLDKFH